MSTRIMDIENTMTIELDTPNSTTQTGSKTNGFGAYLKTARETMRLTVKEAAARLHLPPNTIEIMESENYLQGPPTIFLRGYLRSYARLLNISDSEVNKAIAQLELNTVQPPLNF